MATIRYMTHIEFGAGVVETLPAVLKELGIHRPMLVTDAGIERTGLVARLIALMPAPENATLFAQTPPNPTEESAELAAQRYREGACDGLVAIGGGSPMDLAKAVAVLATHPAPLAQYAGMAASDRIGTQAAPLVAIGTTAGTGSEVGRSALICLRDGTKRIITSPYLLPKRALCDPDLTLGMPALLTAGTGMDALTHCIETFLSPAINPVADAIALDGAGRAWQWIERAVAEPGNRQARSEMMMAGIMGGLAFQKGLGAVHALSHPLGALTDPLLHHGTVNAVILPAVLRFNADHVGDKYKRLCQSMGLPAAADLADEISARNARIGIPPSLRAMGVPAGVKKAIVQGAMADHSTATNPRSLSESDFAALFDEAFAG